MRSSHSNSVSLKRAAMIHHFILASLLLQVWSHSPTKADYVFRSPSPWKFAEFPGRRHAHIRPHNLVTVRDFVHRRGGPALRLRGPRPVDIAAGMEATHRLPPRPPPATEAPAVPPEVVERKDVPPGESDGVSATTPAGDTLRNHLVKDLVSGFVYVKGVFADAMQQADRLAEKYAQLADDGDDLEWLNHAGNSSDPSQRGEARGSCREQIARCRRDGGEQAYLGRMAETELAEAGGGEAAAEAEAEAAEARGSLKKKKFLRKLMLPLLLSYKLKFFALVPVLISGLVLLVGSTGLAGFFFALFAAVLSIKHAHMG